MLRGTIRDLGSSVGTIQLSLRLTLFNNENIFTDIKYLTCFNNIKLKESLEMSYIMPKVFVPGKITLVVNVPLWTSIKSGAMVGIKIFKYRKHTVLALTLVKFENSQHSMRC